MLQVGFLGPHAAYNGLMIQLLQSILAFEEDKTREKRSAVGMRLVAAHDILRVEGE